MAKRTFDQAKYEAKAGSKPTGAMASFGKSMTAIFVAFMALGELSGGNPDAAPVLLGLFLLCASLAALHAVSSHRRELKRRTSGTGRRRRPRFD